jgi:hypothetical protein
MRLLILVLAVFATSEGVATAQCPAVGADTNCGVVLTILDISTGRGTCSARNCVSISNNQGPFDEIEDTLVGVVNNSRIPITSLKLTSTNDIFGFDGDGICGLSPNTGQPYNPLPAGCPFGPTGYEGPGVSFNTTSVNSGTVNFNPPIAPNGGTAYFSLEESLTAATACTSVINNSVHHSLVVGGTGITALFTSNTNLSYTLAQAAQICGFTDWDWQQTVTQDPCHDVFDAGNPHVALVAPYNDPPLNGYTYQVPPEAVHIPVLWNVFTAKGTTTNPFAQLLSLADHKPTNFTMDFIDYPRDACLSGNANGTGNKLAFTTHLVGLVGQGPQFGVQDTGVGFSWNTTFNGTSGGIHVRNVIFPPDPGSGTGGITTTKVNDVTSYQFPKSFGVEEINGDPVSASVAPPILLGTNQIEIKSSGLAFNNVTQTFDATIKLKNVGSVAIDGPFQVVFDSLTDGVALANATSTFGGWPFITVQSVGSLAPGQTGIVQVRFNNPGTVAINSSPLVYAGSFN